MLGNATSPLIQLIWPETLTAAQSLKLDARLFTVRDAGELSATFEAMAQYGADAVVVLADALFNAVRKTIIQLAAKYRLPAMYEGREYAQDGGLISYGPNAPDMARRSAAFVDKILKGAKPGDLPIEQPSSFELTIILKTAQDARPHHSRETAYCRRRGDRMSNCVVGSVGLRLPRSIIAEHSVEGSDQFFA